MRTCLQSHVAIFFCSSVSIRTSCQPCVFLSNLLSVCSRLLIDDERISRLSVCAERTVSRLCSYLHVEIALNSVAHGAGFRATALSADQEGD
jgi:hypothetical protein